MQRLYIFRARETTSKQSALAIYVDPPLRFHIAICLTLHLLELRCLRSYCEIALFLWDEFDIEATNSSTSRVLALKRWLKKLPGSSLEIIISTSVMNTPTLPRILDRTTLCMWMNMDVIKDRP